VHGAPPADFRDLALPLGVNLTSQPRARQLSYIKEKVKMTFPLSHHPSSIHQSMPRDVGRGKISRAESFRIANLGRALEHT